MKFLFMTNKTPRNGIKIDIHTIETSIPLDLQQLFHQVQMLNNTILTIQDQFHTLSSL